VNQLIIKTTYSSIEQRMAFGYIAPASYIHFGFRGNHSRPFRWRAFLF